MADMLLAECRYARITNHNHRGAYIAAGYRRVPHPHPGREFTNRSACSMSAYAVLTNPPWLTAVLWSTQQSCMQPCIQAGGGGGRGGVDARVYLPFLSILPKIDPPWLCSVVTEQFQRRCLNWCWHSWTARRAALATAIVVPGFLETSLSCLRVSGWTGGVRNRLVSVLRGSDDICWRVCARFLQQRPHPPIIV